jgi:hypothetical protein
MLGTAGLIGKNARVEEKGYFDGTSIRLLVNPDKAATVIRPKISGVQK